MKIMTQTLAHGPVQVQYIKSIEDDGVEYDLPLRAKVLNPGDDVSGEPQEVQNICAIWWTPDRIALFDASQPEGDDAEL